MELLQPKLRFIEFKNQWIKTKLGALGVFKGGGTPATNKANYWKGNTPWISSSDILENDIFNINITRYISNEAIEESAAKIVPLNSVLFVSRVGIGKLAVSNLNLCTSQDFANLTPKKDNSWFIAYYFLSKNKLLHQFAQGTSIKGFTTGDLKSIPINLPSLPEQQKIASFLTDVDNKITKLTKKKDLLEQYKKGIMQKIFSQELRFKDDNGNEFPKWEEKKLGEVATKKSSNISANTIEENSGEFKIYGASGLLKKIDFYREEEPYISIVKDGAGVGRTLLCDAFSSVLGTLDIIKPKKGVNLYFIYCLLNNINFLKFITGSTIPHIYFKDYSTVKIEVPCLDEQTKIANFLSDIDIKIEALNTKIEHSKSFKKGLLQQMFV